MHFRVIPRSAGVPDIGQDACILREDGWDDFHHQTMFDVHLFDEAGQRHDLGSTKITFDGMGPGRVPIPPVFEALTGTYCSLGQDRNYYETIAGLPVALQQQFLEGIRDCVFDPAIWEHFRE